MSASSTRAFEKQRRGCFFAEEKSGRNSHEHETEELANELRETQEKGKRRLLITLRGEGKVVLCK